MASPSFRAVDFQRRGLKCGVNILLQNVASYKNTSFVGRETICNIIAICTNAKTIAVPSVVHVFYCLAKNDDVFYR